MLSSASSKPVVRRNFFQLSVRYQSNAETSFSVQSPQSYTSVRARAGSATLGQPIRPFTFKANPVMSPMRRRGALLLHPWNGLAIVIMGVPRGPHGLRGDKQYNPARPSGNTAPGLNYLWPDRLSSFDSAFFIPDGSSPDPALSTMGGPRFAVRTAGLGSPPVAEANLAR
jgi:hypothetical protein